MTEDGILANKKKLSSEALHNQNCFLYLKQIKLPAPNFIETFFSDLKSPLKLFDLDLTKDYDETLNYAYIYKQFLDKLEENIDKIYESLKSSETELEDTQQLDAFVLSIYNNDN